MAKRTYVNVCVSTCVFMCVHECNVLGVDLKSSTCLCMSFMHMYFARVHACMYVCMYLCVVPELAPKRRGFARGA